MVGVVHKMPAIAAAFAGRDVMDMGDKGAPGGAALYAQGVGVVVHGGVAHIQTAGTHVGAQVFLEPAGGAAVGAVDVTGLDAAFADLCHSLAEQVVLLIHEGIFGIGGGGEMSEHTGYLQVAQLTEIRQQSGQIGAGLDTDAVHAGFDLQLHFHLHTGLTGGVGEHFGGLAAEHRQLHPMLHRIRHDMRRGGTHDDDINVGKACLADAGGLKHLGAGNGLDAVVLHQKFHNFGDALTVGVGLDHGDDALVGADGCQHGIHAALHFTEIDLEIRVIQFQIHRDAPFREKSLF